MKNREDAFDEYYEKNGKVYCSISLMKLNMLV